MKYLAVILFLCGVFLLAGAPRPVSGAIIDLTPGGTSQGTANGAIFEFSQDSGGTGSLEPFVRLHANGSEQGYNTSNASVPFDEKTGSWTHDLRLNEIPVITRAGIPYFAFVLDINENTGNGDEFLSLDALRLYTGPVGSQNTADFALLGALRYDLDAGGDSVILLDYNNAPGSGQTDMMAYIPVGAFAGAAPTAFVYFYSQFGLRPREGSGRSTKDWRTSDGFEEWAVNIQPTSVFIPESATLLFLVVGGLPMLAARRKRLSERRSRALKARAS